MTAWIKNKSLESVLLIDSNFADSKNYLPKTLSWDGCRRISAMAFLSHNAERWLVTCTAIASFNPPPREAFGYQDSEFTLNRVSHSASVLPLQPSHGLRYWIYSTSSAFDGYNLIACSVDLIWRARDRTVQRCWQTIRLWWGKGVAGGVSLLFPFGVCVSSSYYTGM